MGARRPVNVRNRRRLPRPRLSIFDDRPRGGRADWSATGTGRSPRGGSALRTVPWVAGGLVLVALVVALSGVLSSPGRGGASAFSDRGALLGATPSYSRSSAATPERHERPARLPDQRERILAALNSYWAELQRHNFVAAFGYLVPGALDLTEGEFIARERHLGVKTVRLRGAVTAQTSSSATVGVVSLVTRDKVYGCRTWSGSYTLVVENGFWRILREALVPRSC